MKTSKIFFGTMLAVACTAALIGCKKDDDDDVIPTPTPTPDTTEVVVGDITTIADALEIISKLDSAGQTDVEYTLQGKITEIMTKDADVPSYGNINLKLTDATGTIACFYTQNVGNVKFTSADEVPNLGAEVIIKGKLKAYAKNGTITPEVVNGYIVKIISNEEPTVKEVTVAEALEVINALADNASTTDLYIVSGTVKSIKTTADKIAQYGNCDFYMTDGTNEIQAFRTNGYDGAKFTDGLISVGDQVKVKGALMKYVQNGTVIPEINKGSLVK